MAIHKLFSKILLIQTYRTTCVSFSCQFSNCNAFSIIIINIIIDFRRSAYNTNNPNNKNRWADVVYKSLDFNFYCDFSDICCLIHQLMLYCI